MPVLSEHLILNRCPHCSAARPTLNRRAGFFTTNHSGGGARTWGVYSCSICGGVTTAYANGKDKHNVEIGAFYPSNQSVDGDLPDKARSYLQQATDSLHAPSGAVMLAASSVDAMLKAKGYKDGSLYSRIEKAASDHVITAEVAAWAHAVRLDANDERHADESSELPTEADASRCIDFASALGLILFTLPARVKRGLSPEPSTD
jgi:hypothetical protein